MISKLLPITLSILVILFISCKEVTTPVTTPENTHVILTIVSGNNQTTFQNTLLAKPVVIKATDENNQPISNLLLSASVTSGNGIIENDTLLTNENGLLEVLWRLGDEMNNEILVSTTNGKSEISCNAMTRYLYIVPEAINDGWEVASLDTSKVEIRNMLSAVDTIRMEGISAEIHSFLIISKNKLVLETYFPGHNSSGTLINFTKDTPHEVQSASKSFRSALIGIAIDKGFISGENAKLFSFFPEYSSLNNDQKDKIILEHILTMSSGLDWNEGYESNDPRNTLSTMYGLPYNQWTNYILSRPMAYEPGSTFVYNTGASIMLNNIIMKSINISFTNFVKQYYSDLLQSTRVPGVGNPLGAQTIPRDMAKLGYIYLNDGKWKNTEIISKAWIDKSINKKIQFGNNGGYGYQWWMRDFSTSKATYHAYYAEGNGGQFIYVIKQLDLVIIYTGGKFFPGLSYRVWNLPNTIIQDYVLPAFE